jgi:hypothetical protein
VAVVVQNEDRRGGGAGRIYQYREQDQQAPAH